MADERRPLTENERRRRIERRQRLMEKRRREKRRHTIMVIVVCILLVLAGMGTVYMATHSGQGGTVTPDALSGGNQPSIQTMPDASLIVQETPAPVQEVHTVAPMTTLEATTRTAHIRACGDIMAHTTQLQQAKKSDGTYDFSPQFELIRDSLANADYTIANLETTIGKYKDQDYSGYPRFNSPESLLDAISDCGVDFLTLANNHMLDRYFDGMKNTVDCVEAAGFAFGGANRTQEEHDTPVVVEVNGIKIGMLCYTQLTNAMEDYCDPAVKEYGVNYLLTADYAADVQRVRAAGAEVVIAIPHWGEEYQRKPTAGVRDIAKKMVAAGVDVVLGSHAHMVQPIEWIETTDANGGAHKGLVAYCLGNFLSDMKIQYTDSGIILDFTITVNPDGSCEVSDVGYVPVFLWRSDDANRAVPSGAYLSEKPANLSSNRYSRMKETYKEVVNLLGKDQWKVLDK